MNYVPFTFVESIHEEKNKSQPTYQHRHNDGFMPQPPLMPDPIGLLCHQVLGALYRGGIWVIEVIFRTVPAAREAGTHTVTVDPKWQPSVSAVAQQEHTAVIPNEISISETVIVGAYDYRIWLSKFIRNREEQCYQI